MVIWRDRVKINLQAPSCLFVNKSCGLKNELKIANLAKRKAEIFELTCDTRSRL